MRWSQTFLPTLKETPSEAEIASHQLLLRAGLVRKLTGGLYTFLPLGVRVLKKIERIVREEMTRAGALEVLMPALQPPDIWQASGRYETASDVFFRVKDRAEKEWILGPTHEEVITTLVANEISSYRQLPKNFFQIQTKFRDEIRPRFGLMRAKEFIMKDAYSFDASDEAAQVSYQKMYDAYVRIFQRCGIRAVAVEADTGVMGGKFSHEFMVPAETGESEVAYTEDGSYAANLEKATSRIEPGPLPKDPEADVKKFPTPGVTTIEALSKPPYNVPASRQIKTLVYLVQDRPTLMLVRGDDQLNEAKLVSVLGTTVFRPANEEEMFQALGAHAGSLGAVGVEKHRVIADLRLKGAGNVVTGANEDGFHLQDVQVKRDIKVDEWADLRTVKAGEPSPTSGQPLKIQRAIEVGHVFKLGTKYSERLNACFLNENGKTLPAVMGCYGIGVTRTLQSIIEQCHDASGIQWPLAVAPLEVCITPLQVAEGHPVMELAQKFYDQLQAQGVEVILDDRDERPGVKFKDSELVGFPIRVGIGEKSLSKGMVEIKPRRGELVAEPIETAVSTVLAMVCGKQGGNGWD